MCLSYQQIRRMTDNEAERKYYGMDGEELGQILRKAH